MLKILEKKPLTSNLIAANESVIINRVDMSSKVIETKNILLGKI